jgi:hypothetical protein
LYISIFPKLNNSFKRNKYVDNFLFIDRQKSKKNAIAACPGVDSRIIGTVIMLCRAGSASLIIDFFCLPLQQKGIIVSKWKNMLMKLTDNFTAIKKTGTSFLSHGMHCSSSGIDHSFLGISRSFLGISRSFLGIDHSFLGISRSFLGISHSFLGISHSFLGISRSFPRIHCSFPFGKCADYIINKLLTLNTKEYA